MLHRILMLVIVALPTTTSSADDISDLLDSLGFVERGIPVDEDWTAANRDEDEYVVENLDGLIIRKWTKEEEYQMETVFEVEGVKYIGVDKGEFGGGLFIVDDLSQGRRQLMEGNIQALLPVGESLYVFEGLAHMTSDRGSVSVIRVSSSPSTPERVTLLPGAPAAVMLEEKSGKLCFTIVGHDYFAQLIGERELRIIADDTFWGSLYPTSIVKYGEYYLVGIRSGIVLVESSGFPRFHHAKLRYFVPEE